MLTALTGARILTPDEEIGSGTVLIEDGRIAEMGTHAELLRAQGHYYRLYTKQFRRELEQEYDIFKVPSLVAA